MDTQVESETKEMTVKENVPGEEMKDSRDEKKVMTGAEIQEILEQRRKYIRESRFQVKKSEEKILQTQKK